MPALLGIPALISFISGFISSVLTYLAVYFTKKATKTIFIISVFLSLLIATISSIEFLLSGLITILPDGFDYAISLIIPDNFYVCASAILSLKAIVFVFDIKERLINYWAS